MYNELNERREPAIQPLQREKWGRSVDLLAALRIFQINIFTVQLNPSIVPGEPKYKWKLHSPKIESVDPSDSNSSNKVILLLNFSGYY